jgi:transglutaminase/protease-like cytokinesis protein 3
MDIPCILVTGTAKEGEGHAWNLAFVDGEWTYVDTTWGDASYRNIMTGEVRNEITYDYLCVGDEELKKSHHVKSLIELPEAVTIEKPLW